MKKALIIITVLGVVIFGLLSGCIKQGTGTLVLQITDAPGDLNITEALVTMSHVEIHFAGLNQDDTNGSGCTVVDEPQTFDLIAIQNVTKFFSSSDLKTGWYTQIRLSIDEALVTIDRVQYNLSVPSEKVILIKPFQIKDKETTTLTLDFDIQKSVHETNEGTYIFTPTIKVIKE